jgi:hypothetical protein
LYYLCNCFFESFACLVMRLHPFRYSGLHCI